MSKITIKWYESTQISVKVGRTTIFSWFFFYIDWEQRKLGEITIITKGQQINKSKLDNTGVYYVLNGGMSPSGYTDTYNTKGNTISISEGGNSCGYVNYNFEPFWSGGHNYTLLNPKIDVIYLYQVLKFIEPQIMALRVGSGLPNVQKSRLQEVEIVFPKEEEQKKVGAYLEKIDKLITLHQRKETKKSDKNAVLQKGKVIKKLPNDWEQRKLGEFVKEVNRTDAESTAPIMMITAENGFINQSERYAFNNAGESLKKYILLKKGELAYNHGASKLRPFGSCFALKTAESARIPFVYHCFSTESSDAEFLSIELNGHNVENQLRRIVSSGARMDGLLNISFDEYVSVDLMLPNKDEQVQIANCFERIDKLITLHQRE